MSSPFPITLFLLLSCLKGKGKKKFCISLHSNYCICGGSARNNWIHYHCMCCFFPSLEVGKMLVTVVYFLRIQLISLSPFHAFLTPLSPSAGRGTHIDSYTFFLSIHLCASMLYPCRECIFTLCNQNSFYVYIAQ